MRTAGAHAATDVTGFGLAGHLHEMLEASGVGAVLDWDALPLFDGAWDLSAAYCRPNRTFSIMDFAAPFMRQGSLDDEEFDNRMAVVCDPQTSGGLLVALPQHSKTRSSARRDVCPRASATWWKTSPAASPSQTRSGRRSAEQRRPCRTATPGTTSRASRQTTHQDCCELTQAER